MLVLLMVLLADLGWVHFSILISFDWWFYLAGEKGKGRALSSFPELPRLAGYLASQDQDPDFPPEQGEEDDYKRDYKD